MSLQITGWPGLNDRKNYIATDEESPSDRKPWYQCDFCRNQKKERKKRKREKIVRNMERKLPIVFNTWSLSITTTRVKVKVKLCKFFSKRVSVNDIQAVTKDRVRADSPNNRTNVMKHGSSIDINVAATIEYDRETQSRSHPIKERNVESLVPSFVPSVLTRNYQRQRTPTGRGGWV